MSNCIKGSDGVVKIGATAVGQVKAFNIDVVADVGETTSFDSVGWMENCALIKSWSGTMDIIVEIDETGQDLLVVGAELTDAEFFQNGSTTGGKSHKGDLVITGINQTSITGSVVEASIAFIGTGALVSTTVA